MAPVPRRAAAIFAAVLPLLGPASARAASADKPLPPVVDASAMDRSADPCRDFFQYACGTWVRENPVPADQSVWYRFSELDEHTLAVLRALLAEAAVEKPQATEDARKIGAFYQACMDAPAIEAKGLAPIEPELARVAALKDKAGLAAEIARLQTIGVPALFSFYSTQDYTDARRMIASADQGGLSLPDRDYYLTPEFRAERAAFVSHVAKMMRLLGDEPKTADAEAAAVLRVETALAKASMSRVDRRIPKNVHHKMSLKAFERLSPAFDWPAFLAGIGAPSFRSLDVADPGFFKALDATLASAPLDDWKAYLRWSAVNALESALPKAFVDEDFDFYGRILSGQKEIKPRWKRCVSATDGALGMALGREYVAREFGPAAKARALEMVREIEAAMADDIRRSPWMGARTKKKALVKLRAVADKIGYPDKWRDYSKLEIAADDALGNLERADAFESHRELAKIGKPVDRGEWDMTPPTDNAYYDDQLNSINFPAGILQRPNFDVNADYAALFGAIGATIGHELTHGFDDEGRHYDAHGNLRGWWTKADAKAFAARAQGFIDEYSAFVTVADPKDPAKDVRLNGKLTLGENIADNGGLFLAYAAFKKATAGAAPPDVDGLTPDQRFFLSYGQSWCSDITPETARKYAQSDPHSTGRWRVDGVVSNMPQFAKAFSCKEGDPMAPAKRNRVW
ncbi:MAG: M13 family metallopeptidase [Elusimicrobia bacterium]|nr:M13 family metallopeptidase [Elusimicrobiota bacterium]